MKKIVLPLAGVTTILFLVNWGTQETNYDEQKKDAINFYGTLETWQGQRYNVENISIDRRTKQIPMYEKPTTPMPPAATPETMPSALAPRVLKQNPTKSFVKTKIDLNEIKALEIPDPERPWLYKKKKGNQEAEYLEIVVTAKDAQETKTSYLIESRKKLYCDRAIGNTSEEREVPLAAMKKLLLNGHQYREKTTGKTAPAAVMPSEATPGTRPVA